MNVIVVPIIVSCIANIIIYLGMVYLRDKGNSNNSIMQIIKLNTNGVVTILLLGIIALLSVNVQIDNNGYISDSINTIIKYIGANINLGIAVYNTIYIVHYNHKIKVIER